MSRRVWLVADDYGISPAVDDGILELLDAGRLSGTACMTLFPEWPVEAKRLRASRVERAGIHLTLTDQLACSGLSSLAPKGKLPSISRLLAGSATGTIRAADIEAELAAQMSRFTDAFDHSPAYIDGHQHVHFLPPVRRWLKGWAKAIRSPLPWLRGAPESSYSPKSPGMKIVTVRALARGFDSTMRAAGFPVNGPLAGFYDWVSGLDFAETVEHALRTLPDAGVLMCHPGRVDKVLANRDHFTDTRAVELAYLSSSDFSDALASSGAVLA